MSIEIGQKIFGIGLSLTGGASLALTLKELGFRAKFLPLSWEDFEAYQALCDSSVAARFPDLDARFPNAKFIYTVRDKKAWLQDCRSHFKEGTQNAALQQIRQVLYGCQTFDEAKFSQAYQKHHDRVMEHFKSRPNDLLILDHSQETFSKRKLLRLFLGPLCPGNISNCARLGYSSVNREPGLKSQGALRIPENAVPVSNDDPPTKIVNISPKPGDAGPWTNKTFALVTLWSGYSQAVARIFEWMKTADLPPQTTLYWVDNSGGLLTDLLSVTALQFKNRFCAVNLIDAGEPYRPMPGDTYFAKARHDKVADLYTMIMEKISEEYIITLEDDTVPPPDGARSLWDLIQCRSNLAMAAGVYRTRTGPERICASFPNSRNPSMPGFQPFYDKLPAEPFLVDRTGAGFALMRRSAVVASLPMRFEVQHRRGWDVNLCFDMRDKGWTVAAHPTVRCEHLCKEVMQFETCHPSVPAVFSLPPERTQACPEPDYLSIVACARDEEDIVEWIEWHAALGVERFYIYDNCSFYPLELRLADYIRLGIVRVILFPGRRCQLRAYAHFISNFKSQSHWVAFIDIDEFILSHTSDPDLRTFLSDYEAYCGLGINWQMFGPNDKKSRVDSVINSYTKRAVTNYTPNEHVKTIVRSAWVKGVGSNPHTFEFKGGMIPVNENKKPLPWRVDSGHAFNVPPTVDKIQLNHYHSKSEADWKLKQIRGGGSGRIRTNEEFIECNKHCNAETDLRAALLADRLKMERSKRL